MQWTKEQKKIIDLRNCNILVSAAAGSGKTAVLVERILEKIMDRENPVDIDNFLVVTFTNAAAAQMREKIAGKIEKALDEDPTNEHLMKQFVLINRADIVTIDSFCLKLVKEHFSMLDIDSTFGIGDSGIMDMLKNDVLEEMFEEEYESCKNFEGDSEYYSFTELVDIFGQDKDDDNLKEAILRINNMSDSYSVPERWLMAAKDALEVSSIEELEKTKWLQKVVEIAKSKLKDALTQINKAMDLCHESGGPYKNEVVSIADYEMVSGMCECESYTDLYKAFANKKWERLKTCKGDEFDTDLVEEYKTIRDAYKKAVNDIDFFSKSGEKVIEEIAEIKKYLIPLIELVEDFRIRFYEVKKQRKMFDFSDIEHMAYKLVCTGETDDNGFCVPTELGKKISERYEEIFIDEYQDSNYLQEDILCSVSKLNSGIYNMFMVGDVKQSIYRFRMARPDLFLMKYDKYKAEGNEVKIELKNNFRSRREVLNCANYFFYQLMGSDLGGLSYNEQVALVPTKEYPDRPDAAMGNLDSEILFGDYCPPENSKEKFDKIDIEANIIAKRIKELVDDKTGMTIYDEELGAYRKAQYKDIVILSRNMKGFGQNVSNVLRENLIPVHADDPKGYFNAVEIRIILSMLRIIDNSRQDVPLAAVLLSPMAGIDENELAIICDFANKESKNIKYLWDKCELYRISNNDELTNKLTRIMNIIDDLKKAKNEMSIQNLIWNVLRMTGYYTYAKSMPMGKRRKANIDMLIEKAANFENGYYKGLFNFLRYIDKLEYNDIDFGEANLMESSENVVRIISMHKSKGLEYPIVFVSGLGKNFNKMDSKNSMIIHSDYYLSGINYNIKRRSKSNTFIRKAFDELLKNENIAEEIRVFYVALTRAKEKLIFTGCDSDIYKQYEKLNATTDNKEVLLPYSFRCEPKSFLQMVLACMIKYDKKDWVVDADKIPSISYKLISYEEVVEDIVKNAVEGDDFLVDIRENVNSTPEDEKYNLYKSILNYEYPYERLTKINGKMSISEIKKMKAFDGQGFDVAEPKEQGRVKQVNRFDVSGAERGTIVHKFMELVDFEKLISVDDYYEFVCNYSNELKERQVFRDEEISLVDRDKVVAMLKSKLGIRMARAAVERKLYKEQQFSIGIPVNEIYTEENYPENVSDVVIVQGIIDAYFVEEDGIVVMDYKTDNADEETLVGRYRAQLDYYAATLEKLTGKKVKEKIIYSFKLNKEIVL